MATSLGVPVDMSQYVSATTDRAYKDWAQADERLDWAKKQFEKNAQTADTVQKQALDTSTAFSGQGKKAQDMYENEYMPAMSRQLSQAEGWDSPAELAKARGEAIAGSNITFDANADMARRALMGYGVDPASGRFAGLDSALAAKRAASAAGVANAAENKRKLDKQALLANAINTGQVLPGQNINAAGMALASGNQAVNTGLATTASGAQTMGTGLQWTGLGDDMIKEWKDALLKQTQLGLQQNRDVAEQQLAQKKLDMSQSSGLGAGLGMAAGIFGKMGGWDWLGGQVFGGSGGTTPGSGTVVRKGGLIKKKYRIGGMVRPPDEEEDEGDSYLHQEPYRPGEDQPPILFREPADALRSYREPDTGTDSYTPREEEEEDEEDTLPPMPQQQRHRRHAEGGRVGKRPVQEMLDDYREPWDPEGEGYDRRGRDMAGLEPEWNDNPASGEPGMRSNQRDPVTGRQLKGRRHPTFAHGIEEDRKAGYGLEMQNGQYYTQPFKRHALGGPVDDVMGIDSGIENIPEFAEDDTGVPQQGGGGMGDLVGALGGGFPSGAGGPGMPGGDMEPGLGPLTGLDTDRADYDTGESIGKGVGGTVGQAIGNIWGPIGGMAGKEIGSHLGSAVGAAVQGHWGEAGENLVEGTPIDLFVGKGKLFAEGGGVPDDMMDEPELIDSPEEEMGEGDVPNLVPPEASPSGGEQTDDVHALLNEGEFVMPKKVTSWYGEKFFQNLIQKAYKEMQMAQAQPENASPQQEQAIAMSPPSFQSMGA